MPDIVVAAKPPVRRVADGPRGYPLVGVLPEMWRAPLRLLMTAALGYGDVVRLRMGPRVAYLLTHPDHIKHVLQENYRNYPKSVMYRKLYPLVGRGLLTSEGDFWRRQRRLIQPGFQRERLAAFVPVMTDTTEAMLARWKAYADSGQPLDVAAEMMRLALAIVGRTLFSTDVSGEAEAVREALTFALARIDRRVTALVSWPERLPTPANRRFQRAIRTLDDIVYRMIDERRRRADGPADLLSMLVGARGGADDGAAEGMTDTQLRDEVMTLMLAGHETTANALAWTWYLLSTHPGVQRRMGSELAEVLGGRAPTYEDLPKLSYTTRVIQESMRLYPPVWIIDRNAVEDDEIDGYPIPAGAFVILSPYVTHRLPSLWENPEGFDPERFGEEPSAGRPRFAYFPFGGGPRLCIGNHFAMMETQLVVATVAQRYRLDLVPGQLVRPEPRITLRPREGVRVTLHAV